MFWVFVAGLFGGACAIFAVRACESDAEEDSSLSDEIEITEEL